MAKAKVKNPERSKKETFEVLDGRAKVFRTASEYWYFQMWVNPEGKMYSKSLGTTDRLHAKKLGQELASEIAIKIKNGIPVFSISAYELTVKYTDHLETQVRMGQLSEERFKGIKTYLRRYLEFVKSDTKITDISAKKFKDYFVFRRGMKSDILATTVKNEMSVIGALYKFARAESYIQDSFMPTFSKIKIPHDEAVRETILPSDYKKLIHISKSYYKSNRLSNIDKYYFGLVHNFILMMAHGGFRTGELRNLKWLSVSSPYKLKRNTFEKNYVTIDVLAHTSKVRKSRRIEVPCGDAVSKLKKLSEQYSTPENFVFKQFNSDVQINKKSLYKYFKKLKEVVKDKHPEFDERVDLYSLRHMFITARIANNISPYDIAKVAGTSLSQINKHYDAYSTLLTSQKINQTDIDLFKSYESIIDDK
jgi:integrase